MKYFKQNYMLTNMLHRNMECSKCHSEVSYYKLRPIKGSQEVGFLDLFLRTSTRKCLIMKNMPDCCYRQSVASCATVEDKFHGVPSTRAQLGISVDWSMRTPLTHWSTLVSKVVSQFITISGAGVALTFPFSMRLISHL